MSDSRPEREPGGAGAGSNAGSGDEYVWVDVDEDGHGRTVELGPIPVDALPGMARIAAGAAIRGWAWSIGTGIRAGRRLTEAALSGESAAQLFDEVRDEAVESLRNLIGVVEREPRAHGFTERIPGRPVDEDERRRRQVEALRERAGALFDRAAEVDVGDEPIHPGFERIIDQLAPDEARILRLLMNAGPQAIVYVNRAAPLGLAPREVARRLTMVGREAGCLRPELVPAYLDNLVRLGLVAIRRDPIDDESAYQVLEAQPEVMEAMRSVNSGIFRGQSSRRSVHVTDFGRSFCQICFPAEQLTGEFGPVAPEEAADHVKVVPEERDLDGVEPEPRKAPGV